MMLKNYILTAWRNIAKDKFYSFINIFGLAIGLTTAVFILLYIIDELTYDKYHENHERIYRLESHFIINNSDDLFAATQVPLAPTLKDEYPVIELRQIRKVLPDTLIHPYYSSFHKLHYGC